GLLLESVDGEIANNLFTGALKAAIFSLNATGLAIRNNTIRNAGNNGILVWRSEKGDDGTLVSGNRIEDISYAIQSYCEEHGYGIVRELVGHGLGKKMHEDPQVPNYGKRGRGKVIAEGLTVAIEPMVNMGTGEVKFHKDGWTVTTKDNKPSAHFEHDVAVINGKPVLLSTFKYVYEALGIESNEEEPFLYSKVSE
ncbi:MAG: M24 family metallopeptidase, partial [Bacteroidia bacterium]|nr:M24 family metallopeptidase [Bacteroidia bacterium]